MSELRSIDCEDGKLIELFKKPGFGQLTLRTLKPKAKRPRHRHNETNEWWVVAQGEAIITLKSNLLGDTDGFKVYRNGLNPAIVAIPKGTWHEIENVGDMDVYLLFFADQIYDPEKPDKELWTSA